MNRTQNINVAPEIRHYWTAIVIQNDATEEPMVFNTIVDEMPTLADEAVLVLARCMIEAELDDIVHVGNGIFHVSTDHGQWTAVLVFRGM